MRIILVFVVTTLFWGQRLEAKVTSNGIGVLRYNPRSSGDYQNRNLADIWSNIKNAASHAFEFIKSVANNTRLKIANWIQKIKIKAQDVGKEFERRLQEMKERVEEIIQKLMNTGEVVKKCLEERKQEMDKILKDILLDVANCISNNAAYLNKLAAEKYEPVSNKTEYLKKIEYDFNACLAKHGTNEEECLYNIMNDIYQHVEATEDDILQNHMERRSETDDILGTIISCSTDGVIKASSAIANETGQIIECVSQGYLL